MGFLTTVALTVAALAAAGTSISSQQSAAKATKKAAQESTDKARTDAEQRALMDTQAEEKNQKARASLLEGPTSGFGPNTNLARSFLTSL
jgi:hypothetical protein